MGDVLLACTVDRQQSCTCRMRDREGAFYGPYGLSIVLCWLLFMGGFGSPKAVLFQLYIFALCSYVHPGLFLYITSAFVQYLIAGCGCLCCLSCACSAVYVNSMHGW